MDDSSQYEQVCKGEFSSIHAKLDRMDEAIRGNGKPGIQLRLGNLEAAEKSRSRRIWIGAGAAGSLAVSAVWQRARGG